MVSGNVNGMPGSPLGWTLANHQCRFHVLYVVCVTFPLCFQFSRIFSVVRDLQRTARVPLLEAGFDQSRTGVGGYGRRGIERCGGDVEYFKIKTVVTSSADDLFDFFTGVKLEFLFAIHLERLIEFTEDIS